jgi:hypothetical protein
VGHIAKSLLWDTVWGPFCELQSEVLFVDEVCLMGYATRHILRVVLQSNFCGYSMEPLFERYSTKQPN